MTDEDRRRVNEAFQAKLAQLEGKSAAKAPETLAFAGVSIAGGGTFCDRAGAIVDSIIKMLDTFSWFIPDNIEKPGRAFLIVAKETLLPMFCGTAAATATAGASGPAVQTNVKQGR